jgi:hypothetical protein
MAGGYTGYGSSFGALPKKDDEQQQAPQQLVDFSSPTTQDHASPPESTPSLIEAPLLPAGEAPAAAKARRRERRLAAFRRGACSSTALQPVEIEGRGRMLLDLTEGEDEPRRRPRRRQTRGGAGASSVDLLTVEKGLSWPDGQFPWNLRMREQLKQEEKETAARMLLIEKFLDHVSDDEEEYEQEDPERQFFYASRQCFGSEDEDEVMSDGANRHDDEGITFEDLDVEPMALEPRLDATSTHSNFSGPSLPPRKVESTMRRDPSPRVRSPAPQKDQSDASLPRPMSAIESESRLVLSSLFVLMRAFSFRPSQCCNA